MPKWQHVLQCYNRPLLQQNSSLINNMFVQREASFNICLPVANTQDSFHHNHEICIFRIARVHTLEWTPCPILINRNNAIIMSYSPIWRDISICLIQLHSVGTESRKRRSDANGALTQPAHESFGWFQHCPSLMALGTERCIRIHSSMATSAADTWMSFWGTVLSYPLK